ncbi:MAG TPA: DinB family protein [Terracidiphilus sp.]|nr:DinB family protein [Terracidiphilus sp.]
MDFQKALIVEYDKEIARTRKMLEAIPADADFSYKPHAKSMSLGRLAGHVAESAGTWANSALAKDKIEMVAGEKYEPYAPASKEALLAKFEKDTAETKAVLAGFAPARWDENWKFIFGGQAVIDDTKYEVWRTYVISHLVHHRAQLGVYLRLLDKPVPGTYGPSADGM